MAEEARTTVVVNDKKAKLKNELEELRKLGLAKNYKDHSSANTKSKIPQEEVVKKWSRKQGKNQITSRLS